MDVFRSLLVALASVVVLSALGPAVHAAENDIKVYWMPIGPKLDQAEISRVFRSIEGYRAIEPRDWTVFVFCPDCQVGDPPNGVDPILPAPPVGDPKKPRPEWRLVGSGLWVKQFDLDAKKTNVSRSVVISWSRGLDQVGDGPEIEIDPPPQPIQGVGLALNPHLNPQIGDGPNIAIDPTPWPVLGLGSISKSPQLDVTIWNSPVVDKTEFWRDWAASANCAGWGAEDQVGQADEPKSNSALTSKVCDGKESSAEKDLSRFSLEWAKLLKSSPN